MTSPGAWLRGAVRRAPRSGNGAVGPVSIGTAPPSARLRRPHAVPATGTELGPQDASDDAASTSSGA